ncbi:MAG TPA: hypothetical protein VF520_04075 [Thermoleophilaceae bacterium]|jgi:hypothetical protein
MPQDRHDGIAPDAPPTSPWNEFNASHAEEGQYVRPSASIPDEYWHQAAKAQVASRSDTSTVACWAFVLLGLIIPIMALGAGAWAAWMTREDSRFAYPAGVGFGIFALAYLA